MKLTESKIRQIARRVLQELFTKKSGLGLTSFVSDTEGRIGDYGDGGDGYEFGESEEMLEEEETEEEE